MTIQSFRNAELDNVILEIGDQDEWKQLAAQMGLDKQMEFVQQAKSPLPYPYMNQSMQNIFGTLCGSKVDFKEYSKTPMPLEVMRELAFCVSEKYFNDIKIWYDDKTPDPIAVGTSVRYSANYYKTPEAKAKSSYMDRESTPYDFTSREQAKDYVETMGFVFNDTNTQTNQYLIARWADELRPVEELKKLALERLKDKYLSEWNKAIKELQLKINTAAETLNLYLIGEVSEWDLRRNL
jgi:hypothetical protein